MPQLQPLALFVGWLALADLNAVACPRAAPLSATAMLVISASLPSAAPLPLVARVHAPVECAPMPLEESNAMTLLPVAAALLVEGPDLGTAGPSAEPDAHSCTAAIDAARALTETLPASDLSRRFAERHLLQARVEAGNGEFDDCMEFAQRATDEVREQRHALVPGATLESPRPH